MSTTELVDHSNLRVLRCNIENLSSTKTESSTLLGSARLDGGKLVTDVEIAMPFVVNDTVDCFCPKDEYMLTAPVCDRHDVFPLER